MATPKIKIYKLNSGYSQAGDSDIQASTNDELLPIVDKSIVPTDAYYLTGVVQKSDIMFSVGLQYTETLSGSGTQTQTAANGNWLTAGGFSPVLTSNSAIIASTNYAVNTVTGSITFSSTVYGTVFPTNVSIVYWTIGASSSATWGTTLAPLYSGANYAFREEVSSTGVLLDTTEYVIDKTIGLVTLPATTSTAPTITYYALANPATLFISEHPNWLINHMNTNPDIFVGLETYPGDDSEDSSGNPIVMGAIPKFVSSGYTISYRDGTVTFSNPITTIVASTGVAEYQVRANYAYFTGIKNVTSQTLDLVSTLNGWTYKAVSEKRWTDSHNRRWVTRNDYLMPRYFQVGTTILPQEIAITPYDTAALMTQYFLSAGSIYDMGSSPVNKTFLFNDVAGSVATLRIAGQSIAILLGSSSITWDNGGAQQVTLSTVGTDTVITYANFKITVRFETTNAVAFTVKNFTEV